MGYVAEGRRLGIRPPVTADIPVRDTDLNRRSADGLHISCVVCRKFRNEVREALAAEAAVKQPKLEELWKAHMELPRSSRDVFLVTTAQPKQPGPININARFDSHRVSEEQAERIDRVRRAFKWLARRVIELTPSGREQSIALTHLEEGLMMAVAAIAREEQK